LALRSHFVIGGARELIAPAMLVAVAPMRLHMDGDRLALR
jgi:hypothetical protein